MSAFRFSIGLRIGLLWVGLLFLAACHDDKDDPPPPAATYSVGGTVSGLTGSVSLANNGGDVRTVSANGAFTFATALAGGASYAVTITSQPANQSCTVASGAGSVAAANVTTVAVTCATNTFMVGGTVTGLVGSVTLANNGADARTVSADGGFTFATPVAVGLGYNVTVATQPADQNCAVTGGSGTIGAANITSVSIACETVSASATVGANGATVNGPDGVQVIIPPGALSADTVIRIARATSGIPDLPDDVVLAGRVYEITPHDIRFNTEVLVRLPITGTATGDTVFVAEADGSWQLVPAEPAGGAAQVPRIGFSYFALEAGCGSASPCIRLSSNLEVVSTPVGAVTRNPSGVSGYVLTVPSMYWTIQQPGLARLRFRYSTTDNCGGHRVRFARTIYPRPPFPNSPLQVLLERPDSPVPFGTRTLRGDVSFDVTSELTEPVTEFHVTAFCTGGGRERVTFGQAVVLGGPMQPLPMVSVGGTVSGLAGSGLVLQNNGGSDYSIAANGPFTFGATVTQGSSYLVTVRTQPANGNCSVSNSNGIATADVTSVVVTCVSTAPTGGLALVSNNSGLGLSVYRRDSSTGLLTALGSVLSGSNPFSMVVRPDGRFAYASNLGGGSVATFSVDRLAGSLVSVSGGGASTQNPYGITMDPQGRFLWVANYSSQTVSAFDIDPTTGALTFRDISSTGLNPYAIAVHPTLNYLYVLNEVGSSSSGGSISRFSIDPTGEFEGLGTLTGVANRGHSIVITPNGSFAYVLNSNDLTRFTIDSGDGSLIDTGYTSFTGSAANGADRSLAVHPNGSLLFMSNQSSVQVFSINASSGDLTALGQPVSTGSGTGGIALDETGNVLYVVNTSARTVATYSVDAGTGALSFVGSVATGDSPMNVTIVP